MVSLQLPIVEAQADPNHQDSMRETALMEAVWSPDSGVEGDVTKVMTGSGA